LVTTPLSALVLFGMAGFGHASYTSNSLACPADIVPTSASASVWGIGCIGTGLGGALFQGLSGAILTAAIVKHSSTYAYNCLFLMYGTIAVLGMLVMIFIMGVIQKNDTLHAIVNADTKVQTS